MSDAIRERLIALQRQRGETDEQFAAHLGLTRSGWTQVRLGRRHLSYKRLRLASSRFPELALLVLRDLTEQAEVVG